MACSVNLEPFLNEGGNFLIFNHTNRFFFDGANSVLWRGLPRLFRTALPKEIYIYMKKDLIR